MLNKKNPAEQDQKYKKKFKLNKICLKTKIIQALKGFI